MDASCRFVKETLVLVNNEYHNRSNFLLKKVTKSHAGEIHQHLNIVKGLTFPEDTSSLKNRVTLLSDLEKDLGNLLLRLDDNVFGQEFHSEAEGLVQLKQQISQQRQTCETLLKREEEAVLSKPIVRIRSEDEYTKKYDSVEFLVDMNPEPARPVYDNAIDPQKVEKNILGHQPENREVVRTAFKAVRHVTQEEFEKELRVQIEQFNQNLSMFDKEDRDYVIVTHRFKSSFFACNLSLRWLEPLPKAVINDDQLQEYAASHPKAHILCVDDACYSGNEMASFMKYDFLEALKKTQSHLFLAIPFITDRGIKKLEETKQNMERTLGAERIHLPRNYSVMKSIMEQVPDPQIQNKLFMMYGGHSIEERTLTYFAHKIPDEVSTLEGFLNGEIYYERKLIRTVPVMQKTIPPYKGLRLIQQILEEESQNRDHHELMKRVSPALDKKILFFKTKMGAYVIDRQAVKNNADPIKNNVMIELKPGDRLEIPVWEDKEVVIPLVFDGTTLRRET